MVWEDERERLVRDRLPQAIVEKPRVLLKTYLLITAAHALVVVQQPLAVVGGEVCPRFLAQLDGAPAAAAAARRAPVPPLLCAPGGCARRAVGPSRGRRGAELPEDELLCWLRAAGLITYSTPLLGGLLEKAPAVLAPEALPQVEPKGCALVARVDQASWAVMMASGHRHGWTIAEVPLKVAAFFGCIEHLAWAKEDRCPWECKDVRSDRSARAPGEYCGGRGRTGARGVRISWTGIWIVVHSQVGAGTQTC